MARDRARGAHHATVRASTFRVATMDTELIAGILVFLGTMFLISALLGGLFPGIFRNRKTGELPNRKTLVARNVSLGCICYLIVLMLMYQPA